MPRTWRRGSETIKPDNVSPLVRSRPTGIRRNGDDHVHLPVMWYKASRIPALIVRATAGDRR
jgi:hypothetical protein